MKWKSIKLLLCSAGLAVLALIGCSKKSADEVVIYVSEDQVFAEPLLREFEKTTGIKIKLVFDTEEAKSTGVMNRLIAEKDNPQADLYWANEPIRAEVLKQKGISASYVPPNAEGIPSQFKDPEGYWTGFSARVRILLVHKKVKEKPSSLLAYTEPQWRKRMVIANPLFGTTTAHIAALFTVWGEERAKVFLENLKKNSVRISTSNGESADFIASGQVDCGLVDSDDGVNRIKQGSPVEIIYPDQQENGMGCMVIPNAVVLIAGAPHPDNAKKLMNYLVSQESERALAFADCAQIPLHKGVEIPPSIKHIDELNVMVIDYRNVARKLTEIQPYLKNWVGY
jgi:iron(III) transport system substrate-binding protein